MNPPSVLHIAAMGARDLHWFLKRWKFVNRETGRVLTFEHLWDGQEQLVRAMLEDNWLFGLKAGKLGFSEVECAFDGWRALFAHPHARVHILSKDDRAAKSMLNVVRFGLEHLPPSWGVRVMNGVAGGDTATQIMVRAAWMDREDRRTIVSYASTSNVAIDQSAAHTHLDEFCHIEHQEAVWNSLSTTISPEGTMHIISRGAGPNFAADLYRAAKQGNIGIRAVFVPWAGRPRPLGWRQMEAERIGTVTGINRFAPENEDDALMGEGVEDYIPLERWDRLREDLPLPGPREALVISVDAAVTGDSFAVVVLSRHPERQHDAAIRFVRMWRPDQFIDHEIDFGVPDNWIRFLCEGGCRAGHARSLHHLYSTRPAYEWPTAKLRGQTFDNPDAPCSACISSPREVPPYNVLQVCYDPYQLADMAQRWKHDGIAWVDGYDQGGERLIGDGLMFKLALQGRITHNGDPDLRSHIANAKAKVATDEDSKMRIVKRGPDTKVDAAVAAAMGTKRILDMNL